MNSLHTDALYVTVEAPGANFVSASPNSFFQKPHSCSHLFPMVFAVFHAIQFSPAFQGFILTLSLSSF